MNASRSCIESLHGATCATDEEITSNDGRRADHVHVSFKTVCPFQFQPPYLIESQTGRFARLIASVFWESTPSVPRSFGNARQIHIAIGTIVFGRWSHVSSRSSQKCGNGFAFLARHRRRHIHHHSEVQRAKNPRRRELFQCVPRWNARVGGIVTQRTSLLINGLAGNRGRQGWNPNCYVQKNKDSCCAESCHSVPSPVVLFNANLIQRLVECNDQPWIPLPFFAVPIRKDE